MHEYWLCHKYSLLKFLVLGANRIISQVTSHSPILTLLSNCNEDPASKKWFFS